MLEPPFTRSSSSLESPPLHVSCRLLESQSFRMRAKFRYRWSAHGLLQRLSFCIVPRTIVIHEETASRHEDAYESGMAGCTGKNPWSQASAPRTFYGAWVAPASKAARFISAPVIATSEERST